MAVHNFVLIEPWGAMSVVAVDSSDDDTLAVLQHLVGGTVDVVVARVGGPEGFDLDVWVNDDGLLLGLPANFVATAIARWPLVGPAVLAASTADGETVGLTDDHIRGLRRAGWTFEADAAPRSVDAVLAGREH